MKSDELARLRELHEERENLRRQRNSLPEGREHLALTARIVEINGELLAAVPALLAAAEERDRLSAEVERLRGELEAAKPARANADEDKALPQGWRKRDAAEDECAHCDHYEHDSGAYVYRGCMTGLWRTMGLLWPTRDEAMRRATGDAKAREGGG